MCGEGERKRDGGPGRIVAPRQQHVYVPCTGNGVKTEKKVYVCAAPPRSGGTAEIRSRIIFTECVIVKFPSSCGALPKRGFRSYATVRRRNESLPHPHPLSFRSADETSPLRSPLCCRILLPHTAAAFFCRTASLRTATRNNLPGRVSDTPQKSDAQTLPAGGRRVSDEPPCTPSWWSAANHSHNH